MSKIKKCVGKEGFQRINYLYQASNILATANIANNVTSALCTNLLVNVSKKTVQRLDINMKRTICKGCRSLLLAGVNCRVRIKKKKVNWTCIVCATTKVFDTKNKSYMPWTQQKESIVEILDYIPQDKKEIQDGTKYNMEI